MKLAAKITALLLAGVLGLTAIAGLVALRYEDERAAREMHSEAARLAQSISSMTDRLWALGGREPVEAALAQINTLAEQMSIRIVYFDVDHLHQDAPRVAATLSGDIYSQRIRSGAGHDQLCTLARLATDARPAAIELAEEVPDASWASRYYVWHTALLMGATSLLGAVMVLVVGSNWIGRPLRRLIEKTRQIGEGDLSPPLQLDRKDEFGELATAINAMCDQLRLAQDRIADEARARVAAVEQLRHADRLRTVGRLAAGIAHEMGTPLNVVSGRAGLIASGRLSADEVHQSALTIKAEADRIATIIRQLLDFARRNTPHRRNVHLDELSATLEQAAHHAPGGRDRLDALAFAYLDYARTHAARWRLVFEHHLPTGEPMPDAVAQRIARGYRTLHDALADAGAAPAACADLGAALWSAIHGVCVLAVDGKLVDAAGAPLDPLPVLVRTVQAFCALIERDLSAR